MPTISDGLALGLLIIPILAFLILAHEFGHFFAARSVGVQVEEFGIGIPPRAKGWRRKGVLWSINWIPFGGFVRVKGEDGRDMSEGSMNTKGPAQRAFFLAAGSAMNFLVAIVLSILLVAFQGVPDNTEHVYIADVAPGSPAETAGWLPGDSIYAVDGTVVTDQGQLQSLVTDQAGNEIQVDIRRGDEIISTSPTPRENPPDRQADLRHVGCRPVSILPHRQRNITTRTMLECPEQGRLGPDAYVRGNRQRGPLLCKNEPGPKLSAADAGMDSRGDGGWRDHRRSP